MSRGTSHHEKNAEGRDPKIEGYMDETLKWLLENIKDPIGSVLDLGCDYGYMLHQLALAGAWVTIGVDTHFTHNPFNLKILRESMSDPLLIKYLNNIDEIIRRGLADFDLVILNHSLEHVSDPHVVLRNVKQISDINFSGDSPTATRIFIGLPHADGDWATWDGHLSLWTEKFLVHVMKLHGFELASEIYTPCFRGNLKEIWAVFE